MIDVVGAEMAVGAHGGDDGKAVAADRRDGGATGRLPAEVTSLVGRRTELAQVKALAQFATVGADPLDHANTLTMLAFTALRRGDPDRADLLCAESRELSRRHGDRWWLAFTLQAAAEVAFCRGAAAEGEHHAQESRHLLHALGATHGIISALDELAYAATMDGDRQRAARLLGAGHAVARTTGQNPTERRRYWHGLTGLQDSIRGTLGEAAFAVAFEQGRRMDQHDAVNYALRAHRDTERTTPGPASLTPPLTPRESQVAQLLAQGLSNHYRPSRPRT